MRDFHSDHSTELSPVRGIVALRRGHIRNLFRRLPSDSTRRFHVYANMQCDDGSDG